MISFSNHLPELLLVWSIVLGGYLTPGPSVLLILFRAEHSGRGAAIASAIGVACGSGSWALLSVSGLAALMNFLPGIAFSIRIIGALILIWLAFSAFRVAREDRQKEQKEALFNQAPLNLWKNGLTAYLLHMCNPKAAAFWVGLASLGLGNSSDYVVAFAFSFGCLFLAILAYLGWATLFSSSFCQRLWQRFYAKLNLTLAGLYLAAAVKMLTTRLT